MIENPDTEIHVGYFSQMTLIYVHIFNPFTPGKIDNRKLSISTNTNLIKKGNTDHLGLTLMKLIFKVSATT